MVVAHRSMVAGLVVAFAIGSQPSVALPIDRAITIQPIRVCDDAGANCAVPVLDEALVDKVYRQAGIDVVILPFRQFNDSRFLTVTVEDTAPTRIDEWRRLLREPGHQQSANTTTLNAFFVPALQQAGSGAIAISFINGNGMVISNAARIDTFAHEIGHNLGLDHLTFGNNPPDPSNLMTDGATRLRPASIADIAPDGAQRSVLNGSPSSGQIQQARAPLFSVGLNQARISGTPAGFDLERLTLSIAGLSSTKALDKLKVFFIPGGPSGARLLTLASEALTPFIDRGLCSRDTCWVESRRTLVDGTIEITFDFLDGLLRPGLPVNFMLFPSYETLPFGELVAATPFSFTFEFADGFSSQAGFDVTTRSAASDDASAITSWVGEPTYGPPAESLPPPIGSALHLIDEDATAVPAPASAFAVASGLLGLAMMRRRPRGTGR